MNNPDNNRIRKFSLEHRYEEQPINGWDKAERLIKVVSIVAIPVVVAIGGWAIQDTVSKRTIGKDYVSLALSVLTKKDKEHEKFRPWAVKLVNTNSPVPFSDELSKQLSEGEVSLPYSNFVSANDSQNKTLGLTNGDILYLNGKSGNASVKLNFTAGCLASYTWRYKDIQGKAISGKGDLSEAKEATQIKAGPLTIKWSCGSHDSGWVYPNNNLKVGYLPDYNFDLLRL